DRGCHTLTIRVLQKYIAFDTALISVVIRINFYAGVKNGNHFETLTMQRPDHLFRLWKTLSIPRKNAISIHVVDVQINDITRNTPAAKLMGKLEHLILWIVAPPALLIPQKPQRRHQDSPG